MKHTSNKGALFAWLIIIWQIALTTTAIWLTLSAQWRIKIPGEILLALCILQWFILEHDLGHNAFFKVPVLNAIFGHVSSLFSLIPFFPWKNIHHAHHVWTGWKDLDPTHPKKKIDELSRVKVFLINLCWKLWIPVFGISFSVLLFWNYQQLNKLFPQKKRVAQHRFSILFIVIIFITMACFFGNFILYCWLPAFVLYLMIADPLLLSQHTHLDYSDSKGSPVRPIRYILQPAYTRSVIYPKWISKCILYNFDKHGLHHQYPAIPLYELDTKTPPEENSIYWLKWLHIAKRMPASVLIFESYKETGINL